MDIAGEASAIRLTHLQRLGREAGIKKTEVVDTISRVSEQASLFCAHAQDYGSAIRRQTAQEISRILLANIQAANA